MFYAVVILPAKRMYETLRGSVFIGKKRLLVETGPVSP